MFRKIRKISANPMVVVLLSTVFLLFSCQESYNAEIKKSFSGEELFHGIFFGQGVVASHLPALKSVTSINDFISPNDPTFNKILAVQDLLVTTIGKEDNEFFSNFQVNIQSGNHLTIQEAIKQGATKLREAIYKISGLGEEELSATASQLIEKYNLKNGSGELSQQDVKETLQGLTAQGGARTEDACLDIVLILIVIIVAVIEVAWVAIDVLVLVFVEVEVAAVARTASRSLLFDQLVDNVATNLKY